MQQYNKFVQKCLNQRKEIEKHNPNWPHIPDHPYRILIVGGSRSGKTNALLSLITHQPGIEEYNSNKTRKTLIVFDDMIADMLSNKQLNPIVNKLFNRERKLNISIVLITKSYFFLPKIIRLNSTYYFIMKIPNKQELQQIRFNRSLGMDYQDSLNLYKKRTAKTIFVFSG